MSNFFFFLSAGHLYFQLPNFLHYLQVNRKGSAWTSIFVLISSFYLIKRILMASCDIGSRAL